MKHGNSKFVLVLQSSVWSDSSIHEPGYTINNTSVSMNFDWCIYKKNIFVPF